MTWKSASSYGWEYLIVWKDLGLSPIYANNVYLFVIILNICVSRDAT